MKKYKIFILAIIVLILAFSCFTGFVSAPSAMAQPFDDLFPPQSTDYVYFYFDFSQCGITSYLLDDTLVVANFSTYYPDGTTYLDSFLGYALSDIVGFSLVYQLSIPKALFLANDITNLFISFLFPDLTSYGTPSIDYVNYVDSQDVLIGTPSLVGSNFFFIGTIDSSMSSCIVVFGNEYLAVSDAYLSLEERYNTMNTNYNNLQISYREQQQQLISETSRANQAEANYNNLLTQYNSLNTQYSTLQGEYEDLENLYEEARDNADHYQGLLREANAEIDELSADNDRLQGIINNLPPTDLAFGWVGSAFATVDNILSIEIIPNLTIGSLVLIPLVLGVLFFVLRLVRGE